MTVRMEKPDVCEKNFSSFEGKDAKSEGVIPSPVSLVAEEKVSFGLYALSVSSLTVARIRKVYNKLDSKAIAKQVSECFPASVRSPWDNGVETRTMQ